MKTVLSGIQPSAELHPGNYLGAIRNVDVLACALDPERSVLFVPSTVPEPAGLCWAREIAARTMAEAKRKLGLWS